MTTHILDRTVGELVLERPARSRFFEAHGIDYCCGGKRTLREACAKKQVDSGRITALIETETAGQEQEDPERLTELSFQALIENILEKHHAWLNEELPRLHGLLTKVARVHGDKEPRLRDMLRVFEVLLPELQMHMRKEEDILFPVIVQLEQTGRAPESCFGTIANPIRQMEAEHDDAGNALEQLRALSDGYQPPDWACNTYRAVLDGLFELEQNMHAHVHKENNLLFLKALDMEAHLAAALA